MQPTVYEFVEPTGNMLGKLFLHDFPTNNTFIPPHWHDSLEFDLPFVGWLECAAEDRILHADAGDFVLINDNIVHSTRAMSAKYYKGFTLLLPMETVNRYAPHTEPFYFDFEGKESIKHDVWTDLIAITELIQEQPPGYEPMIDAHILHLLSLMLAHCTLPKRENTLLSSASRQMAKDVLEYLQFNYQSQLTLEMVAAHYGFSRTYFSKYFKRCVGINFYECLKRFRLSQAYYEVMHTDRTITDIALRSGFPNVKSFITTFREVYMETPQSYRSCHRSDIYYSPAAPLPINDLPSINSV